MSASRKCLRITIEGVVQGVGFRPFLQRLAEEYHICGWVRNTSRGLEGVASGSSRCLEQFLNAVRSSAPPMAVIEKIDAVPEEDDRDYDRFEIRESRILPGSTLVSPDLAVCPECAAELYDPSDRRYPTLLSTARTAAPVIRSSAVCPMTENGPLWRGLSCAVTAMKSIPTSATADITLSRTAVPHVVPAHSMWTVHRSQSRRAIRSVLPSSCWRQAGSSQSKGWAGSIWRVTL